ncbi:MAG: SEC59/DGK1/VTE5 family protein [Candidatus Woesearchaeota archaeon]
MRDKTKYDYETKVIEVRRKVLHIFIGVFLLILLHYNIINALMIFLVIIISGILSYLSKNYKIPLISWFLKNFERQKELKRFPGRGFITFLIGVLLAIKLFPQEIALASITILIFGDSVSAIYGSFAGKKKISWNRKKNLEGNIFGAIISGLCATLFVPLISAFVASFCAMIFESFEMKMNEEIIDDNIIVPLVAGTTLLIIRYYIPWINII